MSKAYNGIPPEEHSVNRDRRRDNQFERLGSDRPGEDVLRRMSRSNPQLRLRPRLPGILHFGKVLFTETPLLLSLSVVAFMAGVVATLIYFLERAANPNVESFVDALWWAIFTMQTAGNSWRPETLWGGIIGGGWSIIGTIMFYGAIIASVTVFFMRRRERTDVELITTIKRNLDDLDNLSLEELELLRESTSNLVSIHIEQIKMRVQNR